MSEKYFPGQQLLAIDDYDDGINQLSKGTVYVVRAVDHRGFPILTIDRPGDTKGWWVEGVLIPIVSATIPDANLVAAARKLTTAFTEACKLLDSHVDGMLRMAHDWRSSGKLTAANEAEIERVTREVEQVKSLFNSTDADALAAALAKVQP